MDMPVTLLQQGRFDEARQQIQTELAKDPKSVEGFNLLGIVCVSQKDFAGALDAFQHALKLAPSSTRTKVNLGNLYNAMVAPLDAPIAAAQPVIIDGQAQARA